MAQLGSVRRVQRLLSLAETLFSSYIENGPTTSFYTTNRWLHIENSHDGIIMDFVILRFYSIMDFIIAANRMIQSIILFLTKFCSETDSHVNIEMM